MEDGVVYKGFSLRGCARRRVSERNRRRRLLARRLKLSAKRTDEGGVCQQYPFTVCIRQLPPHPALRGHLQSPR